MADYLENAAELVADGETAVAVMTDGRRFEHHGGKGSTGNWGISARRRPRRVIVYKLVTDSPREAEVWIGDVTGIMPSDEGGLSIIHFENLRCAGLTKEKWNRFASTGRQRIRYLPYAAKRRGVVA
jgi:hypothetical protein